MLILHFQLDESCVQQHANERRVRTLEEEDETVSSVSEVDAASAANDIENDLEELASIENSDKGLEENENSASDSADDTDSNNENDNDDDDDDDDDDDNVQLKSEDVVSSDMPRTDAENAENGDDSLLRDSDADTSEDIVSSTVPDNNAEVSEDTSSAVTQTGQANIPADSEAIASVDVKVHELNTESRSEEMSDEFPDTSIELRHVSGSKCVDFISFYIVVFCPTLSLFLNCASN